MEWGNTENGPSTSGFGLDVACARADELDDLCAKFVAELFGQTGIAPLVLDVGCGAFGQSMRLCAAGAVVTAVDINPRLLSTYSNFTSQMLKDRITFICDDVRSMAFEGTNSAFDVIYSQRMLHYLKWNDALALLKKLTTASRPNARFFCSVSGLQSELGLGYTDASLAVTDRFCMVAPDTAHRHQIFEPLCLYTMNEFNQLVKRADLRVVRVWQSPFGNIKAICETSHGKSLK